MKKLSGMSQEPEERLSLLILPKKKTPRAERRLLSLHRRNQSETAKIALTLKL
jgi:hypothetical protein